VTGRALALAVLVLLTLTGCASTPAAVPAGAPVATVTETVTAQPGPTDAERRIETETARFGTKAAASCAAVGGTVVGDDLSGDLYCRSGRFTPSGRCGMWAGFDPDGAVNARDRSYSPGCWTP